MDPTFSPTSILQAKHLQVTISLTNLAFEFALLSQIPIARRLVTILNTHHPLHHQTSEVLRPLWLCWASTGEWPDGEREKAGSEEEIERLAQMWREDWWYRNDEINGVNGVGTDVEKLRRTMQQLVDPERAWVENGCMVATEGGLIKALDLRIKIQEKGSEETGIPSVKEILGRVMKEMGRTRSRSMLRTLAQSKNVWELVRTGAIAGAAAVDEQDIVERGRLAEETFKKRFEEGRQHPVVGDMQEMLTTISENTQNNHAAKQQLLENGELEEETDSISSLLHAPASEAAITALEERLNVQLPEDYTAFLRLSNGLGRSWGGILFDSPLFPAEDVKWIAHDGDEDYMADMQLDLLEAQIHYFIDDFEHWPTVGRAIHIGAEDTTIVWLIPPATVAKVRDAYLRILEIEEVDEGLRMEVRSSIQAFCGSVEEFKKCEWCVAEWESTELVGFRSFEAFLAEKVRSSGEDDE